ncbi:MAG TPA: hypothetical protein VF608_15310, partial [Thermoanaerobaculia bacterium]
LPQIEQARMRAALRVVEPKMATAHGTLADEARRRLKVASEHLDRAIALWRRAIDEKSQKLSTWRETHRRSRKHVRRSRAQWKRAVRMLQTA